MVRRPQSGTLFRIQGINWVLKLQDSDASPLQNIGSCLSNWKNSTFDPRGWDRRRVFLGEWSLLWTDLIQTKRQNNSFSNFIVPPSRTLICQKIGIGGPIRAKMQTVKHNTTADA